MSDQSMALGFFFIGITSGAIYRAYLIWHSGIDSLKPSEREKFKGPFVSPKRDEDQD